MVKPGRIRLTAVQCVCAARALSTVRRSAVHPSTVNTPSRGSAACPVTVIDQKKNVISMLLCQRSIFLMLSLLFILQAACSTERNILMALSLLMTKTPVACVTAMEVKLSAPKYLVTENAATLTNHPHSAVENVTVCASPRGIIFLVTRVIK